MVYNIQNQQNNRTEKYSIYIINRNNLGNKYRFSQESVLVFICIILMTINLQIKLLVNIGMIFNIFQKYFV